MHPLSLFPQLLTFGLLAPTLLRVMVSVYLLSLGGERYKKTYKWFAILYYLSALLVFIGLYTQVSVLLGLAVLAFDYFIENEAKLVTRDKKIIYIFAAVILFSLLFTGPGFFAFDLPL